MTIRCRNPAKFLPCGIALFVVFETGRATDEWIHSWHCAHE
jgi:hypothetical protein